MTKILHFLPPPVPLILLSSLYSSLPHGVFVTFWIPSSHSLHSFAKKLCPGSAIRQNNGTIQKDSCQGAKSSMKKAIVNEIG